MENSRSFAFMLSYWLFNNSLIAPSFVCLSFVEDFFIGNLMPPDPNRDANVDVERN